MSNAMEFGDTVVTKLKEGTHHRNDVFVCLYNNMYGRVVGERFIRHLGCCEYAVRLDLSNDVLFFYEDELEVVK